MRHLKECASPNAFDLLKRNFEMFRQHILKLLPEAYEALSKEVRYDQSTKTYFHNSLKRQQKVNGFQLGHLSTLPQK